MLNVCDEKYFLRVNSCGSTRRFECIWTDVSAFSIAHLL